MGNEFTKDAQKMWDSLPEDFQVKVLKSVVLVKRLNKRENKVKNSNYV